ncbi:DUF72 domain-containing protein [Coprothermobacter platensis]|uniref:DUF72 domain-containing protein n=1 Tax=Coprothermobacter platensis TaxID=108819 RepID=UPI00036BC63A|nr:DUF72 domain-containing protein [Coprothermobacter platensis]
MELRVGTSGFSYKDWMGYVYPETIKKTQWFDYYVHFFNTVEINSSFYAIPSKKTMKSLCQRTNKDFLFAVKMYQEITHKGNKESLPYVLEAFNTIPEEGRQMVVLLQFPYSFHKTAENVDYLQDVMEDIPYDKAVEVRHPSWFKDETISHMAKEWNFIPVSQDSPFLRQVIPNDTVYMRFHGRNKENWWQHEEAYERYNYLYSQEELEEIMKDIKATNSNRYLLYFNNHYQGKAFKNAQMLLSLWNID